MRETKKRKKVSKKETSEGGREGLFQNRFKYRPSKEKSVTQTKMCVLSNCFQESVVNSISVVVAASRTTRPEGKLTPTLEK